MKAPREWVIDWLFTPGTKEREIERYPDAIAMVTFIQKVQADAVAAIQRRLQVAEDICRAVDALMLPDDSFDLGAVARTAALARMLRSWRDSRKPKVKEG